MSAERQNTNPASPLGIAALRAQALSDTARLGAAYLREFPDDARGCRSWMDRIDRRWMEYSRAIREIDRCVDRGIDPAADTRGGR
jgi:hypothetical protein